MKREKASQVQSSIFTAKHVLVYIKAFVSMSDIETLEEIKDELEETKKIIKNKIIEKINERDELIEDLDGKLGRPEVIPEVKYFRQSR